MRRMCVGSVQWPGKTTRRSTILVRAMAASRMCTRSVYYSGLITAMRDNVRYTSCVCVARDSGCFSVCFSCSWNGLRDKIGIRKFSLLRIWCDTLWISHYDQQKAQQNLVVAVYLADLALSRFPFGPILYAHVSCKKPFWTGSLTPRDLLLLPLPTRLSFWIVLLGLVSVQFFFLREMGCGWSVGSRHPSSLKFMYIDKNPIGGGICCESFCEFNCICYGFSLQFFSLVISQGSKV